MANQPTIDYAWSNGKEEVISDSLSIILQTLKRAGHGKIWRREFVDGLLEGIENITPSFNKEIK